MPRRADRLGDLIQSISSHSTVSEQDAAELTRGLERERLSEADRRKLERALYRLDTKLEPNAKRALAGFLGLGVLPPAPALQAPSDSGALGRMRAKLDSARQGGISAAELQSAEREVARELGAEAARAALRQALPSSAAALDLAAVEWLQESHAAMDGQIERYQTILASHLKDAQLLDANFDGKLDENDLVFAPGADGKIDVRRVGQTLRDRIRISNAIIDACRQMEKAGHAFGSNSMSPEFWDDEGPFTELKRGVKPADAINDIFTRPDDYRLECLNAMVIVYYKAILDLIGPEDFNRLCQRIYLRMGTRTVPYMREKAGESPAEGHPLRSGERGYIKNWEVSPAGSRAGWMGENVIALGDGTYWGHPFGIATAQEMIEHLNSHRLPGSRRSASFADNAEALDELLLTEDRKAG